MNTQIFGIQLLASILSQFINLAHKYTSTQVKHKNKNLNYDDLFQNIITAISKAIDKYDSSKGALTSYVKYWIINAQNQNNSHTDGLAYEITYTQRQKVAKKETSEVNFSTSLYDSSNISDSSSPESITEEKDSINRILKLIKIADIDGIFRLINNIDEYITPDEITLMKSHMEEEVKSKLAKKYT
jgi:RNA polymerase sigma factor (sigma-70 family)